MIWTGETWRIMTPVLGFYESPFMNWGLGLVVGFSIGALIFGGLLLVSDWLDKKRLDAKLAKADREDHGHYRRSTATKTRVLVREHAHALKPGTGSIRCCVNHGDHYGPCIKCEYCGDFIRPCDWDDECSARRTTHE